jgi:ankyrin repeat protein
MNTNILSFFAILLISCMSFAESTEDALIKAAVNGDLDTVKTLFKSGKVDINRAEGFYEMTALHYALFYGGIHSQEEHCAVAKYLIKKNARLDLKGGFHDRTAQDFIDLGYCRETLSQKSGVILQ